MTKIIETVELVKDFNGFRALNGLNLSVNEGDIFGLLGANGAGKTTTIKILLGLLNPTEGEARVFGINPKDNREKLLERIGYVSENTTLYQNMTVEELLKFTKGFYPSWDDNLEKRYMDLFNLRRKEKIRNLSKGMKAQLSLIAALSFKPDLLVLDEPTNGLDPILRQEFLQVIIDEISKTGTTVFFSSHILSEVERVANNIAIIKSGKVSLLKEMDDIKTNEKVIRVVFQREVSEEELMLEGVKEVVKQGKGYLIKVGDNFEGVYKAILAKPHFALEIIERNLEDVFMEYAKKEVKKDV